MSNNYLSNYSVENLSAHSLFVQPYDEAWDNLKRVVFSPRGYRIQHLAAAIILAIPLVNAVAMLALRFFCTSSDHSYALKNCLDHLDAKAAKWQEYYENGCAYRYRRRNLHPAAALHSLGFPERICTNKVDLHILSDHIKRVQTLKERAYADPAYHAFLNRQLQAAPKQETHVDAIKNCTVNNRSIVDDIRLLVPSIHATMEASDSHEPRIKLSYTAENVNIMHSVVSQYEA